MAAAPTSRKIESLIAMASNLLINFETCEGYFAPCGARRQCFVFCLQGPFVNKSSSDTGSSHPEARHMQGDQRAARPLDE